MKNLLSIFIMVALCSVSAAYGYLNVSDPDFIDKLQNQRQADEMASNLEQIKRNQQMEQNLRNQQQSYSYSEY